MQFAQNQAIYLQIADIVKEKVMRGEWSPDERIPSVRDLAVAMEVNPNTVARTYELLQQQQIIYNKRGIGYFVSAEAPALVAADRKGAFIEQELPSFFNTITLLGVPFEEIAALYQSYLKKRKP